MSKRTTTKESRIVYGPYRMGCMHNPPKACAKCEHKRALGSKRTGLLPSGGRTEVFLDRAKTTSTFISEGQIVNVRKLLIKHGWDKKKAAEEAAAQIK
jgi:hypothetical protein